MTKLREEIQGLDEFTEPTRTDELINLFKRWALEMVGEDDLNEGEFDGKGGKPDYEVRGFNNVKQEIRERIEEATK